MGWNGVVSNVLGMAGIESGGRHGMALGWGRYAYIMASFPLSFFFFLCLVHYNFTLQKKKLM
jgi:hypothetical protein